MYIYSLTVNCAFEWVVVLFVYIRNPIKEIAKSTSILRTDRFITTLSLPKAKILAGNKNVPNKLFDLRLRQAIIFASQRGDMISYWVSCLQPYIFVHRIMKQFVADLFAISILNYNNI